MKINVRVIVVILTMCGCRHSYDISEKTMREYELRKNEPLFTIIVNYQACTGCPDFYMSKGSIKIPPDLIKYIGCSSIENRDLVLAGHFPFDLLDSRNIFYDSDCSFEVTGKIIGVDSNKNLSKLVTTFYVQQWKKIKQIH